MLRFPRQSVVLYVLYLKILQTLWEEMSVGSLENRPSVLEACDVFLLDAAAVLNVFEKLKK